VVDAAAISAANRIGSAALRSRRSRGASITAESDTVSVAPAICGLWVFGQGVVILGQSGGGGVVLSTGFNPAITF